MKHFVYYKMRSLGERASENENEALRLAARNGHTAVVLELLKIKAVQDNAAAEDNEALRSAAENGHTAVVLELLKIKAVQDNAAAMDNDALRWAARNGHIAVVLELLKIKAVQDNAAAGDNEALRLAAQNRHWSVVLELLKNEVVRNYLAAENHQALRFTLRAGEFGIASLMMDIYNEKNIDIPEDLASDFKKHSETLLAKNKKIDCMASLVTDIYKYNGAGLLQLLEDEHVQAYAAEGNNLALIFAARNGLYQVVLKLIEIKRVCDTVTVNDNEVLRIAAIQGHLPVVSTLLKLEPVRSLAAAKANAALFNSVRLGHWPVASELLKVEAVKDKTLALGHHELLRRSLQAREFKVALLLIRAYQEKDIPLPTDLGCSGASEKSEASIENVLTLEKRLKTAYQDAADTMHAFSYSLINLVFEYTGLPTKFDLETAPPRRTSIIAKWWPLVRFH